MKILLVRTSALGDVVHCLPVLRALRRALPDARIGWVVERAFAPILDGHPDLDALFPVRLRAWRRGVWRQRGDIVSSLRAIRGFRADVAIDLMGNHKGAFLARLSGARRVVGPSWSDRRERESALWVNERMAISPAAVHAVDRALALLPALVPHDRLQPGDADFGGDVLLTDPPAATRELLAARDASRPLVTIQAGAGWANKTYPPAWWGEVARALVDRGLDVWVPEAPGEEHLARRVVESSGGAARVVDAGPFAALAAVLRASRLVLGGDTGPVHLAHALGTPVLCLVGPTTPERNGPYRAPGNVLFHELPCSHCYKRFDEPKACLLALTPRCVLERALELLDAPEREGGSIDRSV